MRGKKEAAHRKKKASTAKSSNKTTRRQISPKSLGASQIREMRKRLLDMKEGLMEAVRKRETGTEVGPEAGDSIDQVSQSIEKELNFELSDNERVTLDQIEAALRRVEMGTYGLCENCRRPITKARLKALPFARYCINCQSSAESVQKSLTETALDFSRISSEETAPEA